MATTQICSSDWGDRKLRRSSSDDANLMNIISNKLGDELLEEILIRLPDPKSACRCKLVCRLWRSVISHGSFNRRFISHRQFMNPNDLKSIVLSFLPPMPNGVGDRDALKVLDCNRDLVLCGFWDVHHHDKMHDRSYLVCNPFTRQWSALPLAPKKLVSYGASVARLVCDPQPSSGSRRFRVVCIYQQIDLSTSINLDVFCSESGEWTKDALVREGHRRLGTKSVVSCNGQLFWKYYDEPVVGGLYRPCVAVFNPFRLDLPPTSIDVSAFLGKPRRWSPAVCQDAVHVIVPENELVPVRASVWRLGKDGKSWTKLCKGSVNKTSKCCNYEAEGFYLPFLHPQRPEIVFFNRADNYKGNNVVLCCDLRREEPELFAKLEGLPDSCHFRVFQPRISGGRFTPIPNFDKLRPNTLLQRSSEPTTPSLNNESVVVLTHSNSKVVRRVRRRVR